MQSGNGKTTKTKYINLVFFFYLQLLVGRSFMHLGVFLKIKVLVGVSYYM